MKRREFLQRTGWALAALGMTEAGLSRLTDRYYRALAQPSARKLALLVGINQYGTGSPLSGCLTDVELQRQLLIHRFGFKPADILTLTDSQATRKNIQDALTSHLREAGAGDVAVFHFSGYGRALNSPHSSGAAGARQNTLVPADGGLAPDANTASDLPEETLLLLLRELPAERVLAVLDTSYTYTGTNLLGNLRIRSRPSPPAVALAPEELAWQEQLRRQTPDRRSGEMPVAIFSAARPNQQAAEMQWNGFSCGLLTYALTQNLWSATPAATLLFTLQQAACSIEQMAGFEQPPQFMAEGGTQNAEFIPVSSLLFDASDVGADGAVTAVGEDGKTAQLWLGGLPAQVLDSYGVNSLLSPVQEAGTAGAPALSLSDTNPSAILQIRSRTGLAAQAQFLGAGSATKPLQVGQLLQEAVRVLPRNTGLTVALDTSLERIERVDATSAFASIPYVSPVVGGDQPADCLFGRAREMLLAQTPSAALPSLSPASYGLFSLGQDLIPNTVGEGGEAVRSAVRRLLPQLQTLLAAKLWRLTGNEGSSRLGVRATLVMVEGSKERVLVERATLRGTGEGAVAAPAEQTDSPVGLLTVPAGSRIQYRLRNESNRPIYFVLLGTDSRGRAHAGSGSEAIDRKDVAQNLPRSEQSAILPGETVMIPAAASASAWVIGSTAGLAQTQLICSAAPLTRTWASLAAAMPQRGDYRSVSVLSNPLPVAQALLQDLHQASSGGSLQAAMPADVYALDASTWATLSFIYRVV
ncbi:caspase family protein [Kamptonema formosum]|uniref:caspase family protein n=1 Tax=Kamptonema formosum TaxID=331992 RepID=UPI00034B3765|nr:caspase family protein [Oscillatoria sp. PCC 10802]